MRKRERSQDNASDSWAVTMMPPMMPLSFQECPIGWIRGSMCIAPTSLGEIDGACRSVPRDRYTYYMRDVLRAKVDTLTFIREHSGDVVHRTVDKFGGRGRRDASSRSRTSSMVLVKGKQTALLSGASVTFPFAARNAALPPPSSAISDSEYMSLPLLSEPLPLQVSREASSYSHGSVRNATGQGIQHILGAHEPFQTGGKSVHNHSAIAIRPAYMHSVRRHYIPNMPLLLASPRSIWADTHYRGNSPHLFEFWGCADARRVLRHSMRRRSYP
jgi:hypothetical protein